MKTVHKVREKQKKVVKRVQREITQTDVTASSKSKWTNATA